MISILVSLIKTIPLSPSTTFSSLLIELLLLLNCEDINFHPNKMEVSILGLFTIYLHNGNVEE